MRSLNVYTFSGLALGLIGLLYYANFRVGPVYFDQFPAFAYLKWLEQPILLPTAFDEWFPSFLHIVGISLFSYGVLPRFAGGYWIIPLSWLLIDVVFELLQNISSASILYSGQFEWADIVALVFGALLCVWLLSKEQASQSSPRPSFWPQKVLPKAIVASLGLYTIFGSYLYECEFPDGEIDSCYVDPVYMSYQELRDGDEIYFNVDYAKLSPAQNLLMGWHRASFQRVKDPGKIYLYGDLLLVNDKLRGTHLFDNSDLSQPQHLAFIKIFGNQDIAINNGVLYLDSFTDIVTLDMRQLLESNLSSSEVTIFRNEGVLQQPDYSVYFEDDIMMRTVDSSKGIVIGYETNDGKVHYFWELGVML